MESEVSSRLKALREKSGLSVRAMSERLGVPLSSYSHYERLFKRPFLPLDFAEQLVVAFSGTGIRRDEVMALAGVAPARVENGDVSPPGARLVPVYDIAASAGPGAMVGYESIAYSIAFPPSYIEKLTKSSPRNLAIISVKGDSMVPTLMDDDVVMIDVSKRSVDFDGLFVFRFGEALHIKRVTRASKQGRILAISDNRALYDPIEYDIADVDVIGRVIWYGRKV